LLNGVFLPCIRHFDERDAITSLFLSKDGKFVLTNSASQELHVWDISTISMGVATPPTLPPAFASRPLYVGNSANSMDMDSPHSNSSPTTLTSPITPRNNNASNHHDIPQLAAHLVRKYKGHQQGRFVIRSMFGGVDEGFIASGSEDGRAYVWRRESGVLVGVLEGHSSSINATAWNPTLPGMLATCSDDCTVRL
jgi:WD40 repeat protein